MREIDRVVSDLRNGRPWADEKDTDASVCQRNPEPANGRDVGGGLPLFRSARSRKVDIERTEPPVTTPPKLEAKVAAIDTAATRAQETSHVARRAPVEPEPSAALSDALIAARDSFEAGIVPEEMVPPQAVADRVDPGAYAVAAAKAAKVFERKPVPSEEPERERMTQRLSGAIRRKKSEKAARIEEAKAQRAALVAERNAIKDLPPPRARVEAPVELAAEPAPEPRQKAPAVWKRLAGFSGASLGAGRAALTKAGGVARVLPDYAGRVTTMTKETIKAAGSGAKSTAEFVRNGNASETEGSGGGPDGPAAVGPTGRGFGPWLVGVGAVCSLLFVGIVSVWTYKLGIRDAMEVPIIQAMAGDARIKPEDAGGEQVAHQGLSVNSVLDGGGASDVADVVVTAPRIRHLTPEDKPASELQALVITPEPQTEENAEIADAPKLPEAQDSTEVAVAETEIPVIEPKFVQPPTASEETAEVEQKPVVEPMVTQSDEKVAEVAETSPVVAPVPTEPETVAAENTALPLPSEDQGVDVANGEQPASDADEAPVDGVQLAMLPSPPAGEGSAIAPALLTQPRARPQDLSIAMAAAVDEALAAVLSEASAPASETTEVAAASPAIAEQPKPSEDDLATIPLPAGTRMIQLGAFDSADTARSEWDRFQRQHGDLLGSKDSYIQRIDNSGRIFYRLRVAGYQTREDTRSACAALSARGLPCITVTLR